MDSLPGRKAALVTSTLALGALVAWTTLRRRRRPAPAVLPKALDADVRAMEVMEGQARYYARPSFGVPLVLLHSINAAGSSFEMEPIFDHFAERTVAPFTRWTGSASASRTVRASRTAPVSTSGSSAAS